MDAKFVNKIFICNNLVKPVLQIVDKDFFQSIILIMEEESVVNAQRIVFHVLIQLIVQTAKQDNIYLPIVVHAHLAYRIALIA